MDVTTVTDKEVEAPLPPAQAVNDLREPKSLIITWDALTSPRGFYSNSPEAWRVQLLTHGAQVILEGEPVTLAVDPEVGGLEVKEHEVLYPLAELRICDELPQSGEGKADSTFGLIVEFADLDTLLLQFDLADQRMGFKAALDSFAVDARRQGPGLDLNESLPALQSLQVV